MPVLVLVSEPQRPRSLSAKHEPGDEFEPSLSSALRLAKAGESQSEELPCIIC